MKINNGQWILSRECGDQGRSAVARHPHIQGESACVPTFRADRRRLRSVIPDRKTPDAGFDPHAPRR
jgi:hypothetical protein